MQEQEIRPQGIFDEYLRLAALDAEKYFQVDAMESISCPACGHAGEDTFEKNGFKYRLCPSCDSLFVSPRPPAEAFERYYIESESSKYWATTFYKETAEARREKLWRPKALSILDTLQRYGAEGHALVDIGGGYGLFAEEMSALLGKKVLVIEPAPHLADVCRERGLPVKECFLESLGISDLPAEAKALVSFELIEHLHDLGRFLDHLFRLMRSGDLFIFTTLSGTGADIQALWEDSKSVSPPHHLNFLNPYSARLLLESHAFELLEVSTPGKLDMDILLNNREMIKDRFWKTFVKQAGPDQLAVIQQALAGAGFSSHMMVVSRKP